MKKLILLKSNNKRTKLVIKPLLELEIRFLPILSLVKLVILKKLLRGLTINKNPFLFDLLYFYLYFFIFILSILYN